MGTEGGRRGIGGSAAGWRYCWIEALPEQAGSEGLPQALPDRGGRDDEERTPLTCVRQAEGQYRAPVMAAGMAHGSEELTARELGSESAATRVGGVDHFTELP